VINSDGDTLDGGNYSWSASGGGQLSDPVGPGVPQYKNVYWTTEGSNRVTVVFTGGGCQVTGYVDVNSVVPTQFTYSATQKNGSIRSDCNSGGLNEFSGDAFSLGCGFRDPGITFGATVQAPTPFISAASDSKIKLVQYVSAFYAATDSGGNLCGGDRTSENNVESGWRLDGSDPYPGGQSAVPFDPITGMAQVFPNSSAHPEGVADSPGVGVSTLTYLRFDLQFEMYLVYAAGDPAAPRVQRVIAVIPWNFGGEAHFSSPGVWSDYVAYPPAQTRTGVPTTTMRTGLPASSASLERCSGPTPLPTPPPDPDPEPDPCYKGYRFCNPRDQY
jgi:hypothetical protein